MFTEHNISRLILLILIIFLIPIIWNRYRKIEILGNCGIAKWYGTSVFFVADIERITIRGTLGTKEDKYLIRSSKYNKNLFLTVKMDENQQRLLTYIDCASKKYVNEPIVEPKYRKKMLINRESYEIKKLRTYGHVIDNAEMVGGIDLLFGKMIPVYKFKDEQGKHMLCGVKRIKSDELKRLLYKKCSIYYAPGKSEFVMEKVEKKIV